MVEGEKPSTQVSVDWVKGVVTNVAPVPFVTSQRTHCIFGSACCEMKDFPHVTDGMKLLEPSVHRVVTVWDFSAFLILSLELCICSEIHPHLHPKMF